MAMIENRTILPVCTSQVSGSGPVDSGYGGVDNDGSKDPDAHKRGGYDDEDFDEEELLNQQNGWTGGLW